jgi:hypothetical protein
MEGSLYLCRDGTLRVLHIAYDHKTKTRTYYYIPIDQYERYLPNSFLKLIRKTFDMEDNLTVRELFTNLEPYANVLEGLGCLDFVEFARESRKPPTSMEDRHKFKCIQIEPYYELRAEPAYERIPQEDVGPDIDGKFYSSDALFRSLGIGAPKKTNRVTLEKIWTNSAILRIPEKDEVTGYENDSYSVSYTPVCDWSHLPIHIKNTATLTDDTQLLDFMDTDEPLLNPNHPLVKTDNSIKSRKKATIEIQEEAPSFQEAIIEGCLYEWGFHYSPMQRDEMMKHIEAETQKALDELDDKEPSGTPLGEIEDDHLNDDDVREVMDAFVKADIRAWKREEQDDS